MSEVKKETKTKKTTKTKEEKKETKVVKKTTEKKPRTKKEAKVENEIKEEKALLNNRDQVKCKSLCKVVSILAKIGRIALMILVPFIFLTMIVIPLVFKKFEIEANIIKFDDVNIIVNDDKVMVKFGSSTHVLQSNPVELDKITTFLTENSKNTIVTFTELSLFLSAIVMILYIYLLLYIEKLFDNFANKKTPFINENVNFIFKIAVVLSIVKFISICLSTVDLEMYNFSSLGIFSLLIIYALYFVFKYAVKLQGTSNKKIYD